MAKEQASAYGRTLIKIAIKELPGYLDGLLHEDDYARAWVNRYPLTILRRQPAQEKARLLMILLDDWISQEDQLAIQKIATSISTASECVRVRQLVFSGMNLFSLKPKQKYLHSIFEKYVNGCRFSKEDHG